MLDGRLKHETPDRLSTAFLNDVSDGLFRRPRAIPARWLYDHRGSQLFEEITRLEEYHVTRTETALLEAIAREVASLVEPGRAIVELGAGSSAKTPTLLDALAPSAYVPIDISRDYLKESTQSLSRHFEDLPIFPVCADFLSPLVLPPELQGSRKLCFFPGSTIGNLTPEVATDLLRTMRSSLGDGAMLLIGMDRIGDADRLRAAYDDCDGVTAAFNVNLLHRINRELEGTIPVEAFRHKIVWDDDLARIEMHLEAKRDVAFAIEGRMFAMIAGETIHTENSHKYGSRDARLLLAAGGWATIAEWSDPEGLFAIYLAEARRPPLAP